MYSMIWDLQRANANLFFRLASKSIDAFQKTTELAVDATRSAVSVAQQDADRVLAEQRREASQSRQVPPAFPSPDVAQSYARELFDIASEVQAGLAQWTREQIGAQQETMRTFADQVGRVSDTAAKTADEFSGIMRQNVQNVSSIAERGARDAAAATEEVGKAARRSGEQQSSGHGSDQGSGAQKH
jgi:hypothetical protein